MGFHSHKGPRSSEWIVQIVVNVCWLLENDPERMDDTRNPSQEGQDQIDEEVGVKSISIDEHLAWWGAVDGSNNCAFTRAQLHECWKMPWPHESLASTSNQSSSINRTRTAPYRSGRDEDGSYNEAHEARTNIATRTRPHTLS